jgi:MoaA/NifB/PqqE/SkfB family radical SAM enzyme
MNYQELKAHIRNENALFSALVELTYRCNLDCFFCYNDLGLEGKPLSKEQYVRFFQDLKDMGTMNLTLSGGEPLAHRDFFALGEEARRLGFVVRIKSNGHAISGKMAQRIKDCIDPFSIEISLHGAQAETHDRQTRVAGSFDRLMRNLPQMRDMGLRPRLNTPLTRWNEDELEALFALADRLELPIKVSPEITPRDNGDREPLSIAPSAEAQTRLSRLLEARVAAFTATQPQPAPLPMPSSRKAPPAVAVKAPMLNCGTGSTNVVVDPFGNVFPCVQWRRTLGNLHDTSIKAIWSDSEQLREVRQLNREARAFIDTHGPEGTKIGFCPALAEQITGSAVKLYPYAEHRLQTLRNEAGGSEAS